MSLRRAIDLKCRDCNYDPCAPGNWRQQTGACAIRTCALWEYRPKSRGKVDSACKTATAFGSLLATLQIAGCSITLVSATSWKSAMALTKDKQQSLDFARLRYPAASLDRKRDHGRAESIALALFGLRQLAKAAA